MDSTAALLAERGKTHGDYGDHARVTQALKRLMEAEKNWAVLTDCQRETLHMIAHKIGRILTGDPNHKDHYDDIAGYSRLISDRLQPPVVLTSGPGTPEDGGQHARMTYYEDGHTIAPGYAHLRVVSPGGVTYYLADRTALPRHSWDHLPRLAIKMNFAEWNALMGCYQALYYLKEDNNYLMLIKYRELWGVDQLS
jgi:hypothetical protein